MLNYLNPMGSYNHDGFLLFFRNNLERSFSELFVQFYTEIIA